MVTATTKKPRAKKTQGPDSDEPPGLASGKPEDRLSEELKGGTAKILAYKGFNQDFACTPDGKVFQYEVGKSYRHEGEIVVCQAGFHACEHPLNVFGYYPPATSRYAVVELGGKTARQSGGDTKIAAAEITIKAELRLPELIAAAIKFVLDRVKWIDGPIATADGEGVKAKKNGGAATASGYEGKARGKEGCALFLVERSSNGEILDAWHGFAGRDGIKPDTFYRLVAGKPVEVE